MFACVSVVDSCNRILLQLEVGTGVATADIGENMFLWNFAFLSARI